MTKRYCDRCGQQIGEGVHAWYVLELHGTDGEFRHKELCEGCYELLAEDNYIPRIEQTEPSDSEIPNNCAEGVWNAGFKTGYDKGYKDAQKVKDSQDLVKDLVKAFCEDGTWLERQGVYTLTLAEAKQRAVDIIESVTQTETQNSNLTFEKDECAKEYDELGLKELKELIEADRKTEPRRKTTDYCDICNHERCDGCVANSLDDYCVPSNFEQTKRKGSE